MLHRTTDRPVYPSTRGEEVANTATHVVMAFAALCALPYAAVRAYALAPDPVRASAATSLFVGSVFLMFLISALYHAMTPGSRHKEVFHVLDHICIFVAIAGSYTPVALLVIGGWRGTLVCVLQWTMVLCGIFYKSLARRAIPSLSLAIYLVMGWSLLFFLPAFLRHASPALVCWIAAGGLFYTAGAWIYAKKGFRYHHAVWHLLINLGVASHFVGLVYCIY